MIWIRTRVLEISLVLVVLAGSLGLVSTEGMNVRDSQVAIMCVAGLLGLGFYMSVVVDVWAGLLLGYAALQLCRGNHPVEMLGLMVLGLFYVVGVKAKSAVLYDAVIVVVCVNVAFQLMQIIGVYFLIDPARYAARTVGNVNEVSALLGCSAAVFLRPRRYWGLIVVGVGLVLAHSIQGVLAAGVCLMVWAWKKGHGGKMTLGVVLVSTLFVAFVKPINWQDQKRYRVDLWRDSVVVAMVKPVWGWGFGQYGKVMPLVTSCLYLSNDVKKGLYSEVDNAAVDRAAIAISGNDIRYFSDPARQYKEFYLQAHNEYVEMFFIGGAVGLFLMLCFLGANLKRAWSLPDPIPFCGLLSLCAASTVGFQWHLQPLINLTLVYLAACRSVHVRGATVFLTIPIIIS